MSPEQEALARLVFEGMTHQTREHGAMSVVLVSDTLCPASCVLLCGAEMFQKLKALSEGLDTSHVMADAPQRRH
ncbi:MAG: hypothetical protein RLZZ524_470 [Pseudomonadota bacterium]|jgi:hypothetical protein